MSDRVTGFVLRAVHAEQEADGNVVVTVTLARTMNAWRPYRALARRLAPGAPVTFEVDGDRTVMNVLHGDGSSHLADVPCPKCTLVASDD